MKCTDFSKLHLATRVYLSTESIYEVKDVWRAGKLDIVFMDLQGFLSAVGFNSKGEELNGALKIVQFDIDERFIEMGGDIIAFDIDEPLDNMNRYYIKKNRIGFANSKNYYIWDALHDEILEERFHTKAQAQVKIDELNEPLDVSVIDDGEKIIDCDYRTIEYHPKPLNIYTYHSENGSDVYVFKNGEEYACYDSSDIHNCVSDLVDALNKVGIKTK